LQAQNRFYDQLLKEYTDEFAKTNKSKLDAFETSIQMKKSLKSLSLDDFKWTGLDPPELSEWSLNKRLNFERKKLMKLLEFFTV